MNIISSFSIPVILILIILFGAYKKVPLYDTFVEGAKCGLKTSFSIVAPIVGLLSAIYMLRASGAVDILCQVLAPIADFFGFPKEVIPLTLLRPVSGSGSIAIVSDIFKNYGCDGKVGLISSVLCGSTETTFYTLAVYFGAVGVKNTRYTAAAALGADISAIFISAVVVNLFI